MKMSEIIVFVDDLLPNDANYATQDICNAISKITSDKREDVKTIIINGENMLKIRIAKSLPILKTTIDRQVDAFKDILIGICIDMVDRRMIPKERDKFDGALLLEAIKQDKILKHYDVVVYTGKHIEIDENQLRRKGAKGIVRKEVVRGPKKTYELMAERILRLLES
jgi:CheY-like chemotaxis protein